MECAREPCRRGCRQGERRRLTSPIALFGALTPLSLSWATRDALWQRIQAATEATPTDVRPKGRTRVHAGLLGAAAVALAAIIAGPLAARSPEQASVRDPDDVHSTTHQVGVPSSDAQVTIGWSPQPRVLGYSVAWDNDATSPP